MDNRQKLNIAFSMEIPPDYVLITKVEYEELKHNELIEIYRTLKNLEDRTR